MIAHGFVDRATQDVDLFTEVDDAEVRRVTAALRSALRERGLESRDADRPPADHRFVAVDKVLALWGRARPRDFYDVHALMRHYTRDALLQLAAAKDAGFTIETFLDALNALKRLTAADWAEDGIRAEAVPH